MSLPVAINKLSAQLGLTSRTLRHWESEGLFESARDRESGWRVYDEAAVLRINITSVLRRLDIPLKDVKTVLDSKSSEVLEKIIKNRINSLDRDTGELTMRKNMLYGLLDSLSKTGGHLSCSSLAELGDLINTVMQYHQRKEMEDIVMFENETLNSYVRFITLPPMRTVYHTAVGASPEDEAATPVIEWLKTAGLMGTARLFGGNTDPLPSKTNPEYGYGMCASIPEGVEIPGHLKEMRLPGGLFAVLPSNEDIYASWQLLMKYLSQNNEYTPDRSRLCLEEHIRNDNPEGQGSQFMLNLLEPVRRKK